MNILDIEVPLIAAVNGLVRVHSEYILLADIVRASPSTVFQDKPHFEFGIVPGDGVNLLWQEVIGTVRGRYFILTRQIDEGVGYGLALEGISAADVARSVAANR